MRNAVADRRDTRPTPAVKASPRDTNNTANTHKNKTAITIATSAFVAKIPLPPSCLPALYGRSLSYKEGLGHDNGLVD
jgi:hypothetical protein